MAKASAAGDRVVLVCATRGEQGEPQPGVLADGEELWQRRVVELAASCEILGAEPPRWLGYEDSGMDGEPSNDNPACFWQADHDEATERLAVILREVQADTLTIYDHHGGYGHPDHIRVHTVGVAAAARVGLANVFEATINRDDVKAMMENQQARAEAAGAAVDGPDVEMDTFGTAHHDISYRVDVGAFVEQKRQAMIAHRSQIGPEDFLLALPHDHFATAFGTEWFNVPGRTGTGGATEVALLPGLG